MIYDLIASIPEPIGNFMTDLDALHYRENSSIQYKLAYEILNTIKFKGDETILDVGCGDGRITAELSKLVPLGRVMGIDSSSTMINLANTSFHKRDFPNLSFEKISAEKIHLEQWADIILVMNTLHWIRDPKTALRNLATCLKQEGTLFILTYPQESPYWKFLEKTTEEKAWSLYANQSASQTLLTSEEYKKILEDNGLNIDKFSLEKKVAVYSSDDDLKAFIKGWLPCYLPLPQELENRFLKNAIKNAQCDALDKSLNEIHLPYLKLTLKALKIKSLPGFTKVM